MPRLVVNIIRMSHKGSVGLWLSIRIISEEKPRPDPLPSERSDPDPHQSKKFGSRYASKVKSRIWIRTEVMQIRNNAHSLVLKSV
jgi:hypothetical protein